MQNPTKSHIQNPKRNPPRLGFVFCVNRASVSDRVHMPSTAWAVWRRSTNRHRFPNYPRFPKLAILALCPEIGSCIPAPWHGKQKLFAAFRQQRTECDESFKDFACCSLMHLSHNSSSAMTFFRVGGCGGLSRFKPGDATRHFCQRK